MKVIDGTPDEEFVYQNPYPRAEVLLAPSPEATNSDETAFVLRYLETVAFRAGTGFICYGRTRGEQGSQARRR